MYRLVLALTILFAPAVAGADDAAEVDRRARAGLAHTLATYEWFHAHPELSGQEKETAARLASELRSIGLEVHEGIGGHGIVGILRGGKAGKGPVVLYRADMDGLPITEATGLRYASENKGVMHGCGHDIHMATAVGVLGVLAELRNEWSGTVLFVGQPAEEIGAGARLMLADPKMKKILRKVGRPSIALALHDDADLPAGTVSMLPGWANANVDSVDIVVHGAGGHGARPHQTIDPVVIGAEIVMSLQTIVSRRLPAGTKAVVTVGAFNAGTKHNIISPQATLLLTVRSYTDEVRKQLLDEIRRVAVNVARAHKAPKPPTITIRDEYTPAAYNDPAATERLEKLFVSMLGKAKVRRHEPSLGGEDFGRYARTLKIPGVMYRLGAVNPVRFKRSKGKGLPGLHSDKYAPDASPTLYTGVITMSRAILDALGR